MTQLSEHLTLQEFIHSDTATKNGINNELPPELLSTAINLAVSLFEPVRELLNAGISVDSGYRCPALNQLVRGVPSSQHCLSLALDLVPVGLSIRDAIKLIISSGISYDQLIEEGTWLHISSIVNAPEKNRHEILLTTDHKTYQHLTKEQALASL
jgi:zinc D-Ala-D-Ala carboxypeptidase